MLVSSGQGDHLHILPKAGNNNVSLTRYNFFFFYHIVKVSDYLESPKFNQNDEKTVKTKYGRKWMIGFLFTPSYLEVLPFVSPHWIHIFTSK